MELKLSATAQVFRFQKPMLEVFDTNPGSDHDLESDTDITLKLKHDNDDKKWVPQWESERGVNSGKSEKTMSRRRVRGERTKIKRGKDDRE